MSPTAAVRQPVMCLNVPLVQALRADRSRPEEVGSPGRKGLIGVNKITPDVSVPAKKGLRFGLETVIYAPVGTLAQSVEQLAFNQLVDGSNPSRPTISQTRRGFVQAGFLLPGLQQR